MINKFDGEYAFLSNFYECPIVGWDGITYPTNEHYFQAQKTLNKIEKRAIAAAPTPGKSKRMGRNVQLRPDWEVIKDQVMLDALRLKFAVPEMREKLLATGDEELVEGTWWHDKTWGVCYCPECEGRGENRLGKLLMKVREEIKNNGNV